MTCAPVDHLAMVLDISSEIKEPPKPISAAKASSMPRFRPLAVRNRFTPSTLAVMLRTIMTAMLVARNSSTRFMCVWNAVECNRSGATVGQLQRGCGQAASAHRTRGTARRKTADADNRGRARSGARRAGQQRQLGFGQRGAGVARRTGAAGPRREARGSCRQQLLGKVGAGLWLRLGGFGRRR
ncbi:hypothetical protein D3C81_1417630 [compost metagenome]